MTEADWEIYFVRLTGEIRKSIEKFVVENPEEEVCSLCFDSEPKYGYVFLAINTSKASRQHARHWQKRNVTYRRKLYAESYDTWIGNSNYQMRATAVPFYGDNSGDFQYTEYAEVEFPEWCTYHCSSDYPAHKYENGSDDYLENRCAYLFWRVHDTLTTDGTYRKLNLASPTLLEFAFHDGSQCVLDALNLP